MVIKANELEAKIIGKSGQQCRVLEEKIDKELLSKFQTIDSVISVSILSGNSHPYDSGLDFQMPVINAIITKYEKAGWDVKYYHDQREGEYLLFKMRKPHIGNARSEMDSRTGMEVGGGLYS